MIICFDLRALQIGHEKRGIGMYIIKILENIRDEENKYIIYSFDNSDPIKDLNIRVDFEYDLVTTPAIKTTIDKPSDFINVVRLIGHSFKGLGSKNIDVFVQFDFMLGVPSWRKTKKIVIAYDLIPLIKKNQYLPSPRFSWKHTIGYKSKLKSAIRSIYYIWRYRMQYSVYKKASDVIAISESTKKSFVELLGIEEKKITTIPLAPVLDNSNADNVFLKNIDKPFAFYIGGTDSRKKIEDIVFAYNIARGRGADIALILAGNEFKQLRDLPNIEGRNAIINSPYNNDIHLVGFITEKQKLALYKNAMAFVFCSEYEGFGLPVVEAMSLGCPVICYDNSSIKEITNNKSTYLVKNGEYVGVALGMLDLYKNKEIVEKFSLNGRNISKKYSWDKTANQFLTIICS